jgi:hypothetical protein
MLAEAMPMPRRYHDLAQDISLIFPAAQKKANWKSSWLCIWWSWGDLNPRPQTFLAQIYMFSGLI